MNYITQKEIGKRISLLRSKRGLTQNSLAQLVNIPRSALTQIELGNRNIKAIDLKKITDTLSISVDNILSNDFKFDNIEIPQDNLYLMEERISKPIFNFPKAKNSVLYVLEKIAGQSNFEINMLYGLLYFCDFNYFEIYEEHLFTFDYLKIQKGPIPIQLDELLFKMSKNNEIEKLIFTTNNKNYIKYFPLIKTDLTLLKASEKEVIDNVLTNFSKLSSESLSEYSLQDIPLRATEDGQLIDFELAFYREAPYSVRIYFQED